GKPALPVDNPCHRWWPGVDGSVDTVENYTGVIFRMDGSADGPADGCTLISSAPESLAAAVRRVRAQAQEMAAQRIPQFELLEGRRGPQLLVVGQERVRQDEGHHLLFPPVEQSDAPGRRRPARIEATVHLGARAPSDTPELRTALGVLTDAQMEMPAPEVHGRVAVVDPDAHRSVGR